MNSSSTAPARLPMSYEAYLDWVGEDIRAEWVDGEVIAFMPPKFVHQDVTHFLAELLNQFVRLFGLGQVVVTPFATQADEWMYSRVLPGFCLKPGWWWQTESLTPLALFFEMMREGFSPAQRQHFEAFIRRGLDPDAS